MRKIWFLSFLMAAVSAHSVLAQSYQTAVGVRLGEGVDFTVQQYLERQWTLEGIVHTSTFSQNLGATVLFEKHRKIIGRNLNVYLGAGAHYYVETPFNRRKSDLLAEQVWGISGIAGLELSVGRLNISADFKPELHLGGDTAFPFAWRPAAISFRYIIEKRDRPRLRDWEKLDRLKRSEKSRRTRWD